MVRKIKNQLRFLRKGNLHTFIYGRWTTKYVDVLFNSIIPRLGEKGKKLLANNYHSKVLTQTQAENIISLNRDIPLQDLEQIIPYARARNFLLSGNPEIAVFECGCRLISGNPCKPTRVCMVIGQPFVDIILQHRPKDSNRLTTQEALELLKAEHERGHIHSAWFKHSMNDRFYAICNCCKCHCGGIEAMMVYGVRMIAPSGFSVEMDMNRCNNCRKCVLACPFRVYLIDKKIVVQQREKCMGCGVCVDRCPEGALTLVRDPTKGIPLEVDELVAE